MGERSSDQTTELSTRFHLLKRRSQNSHAQMQSTPQHVTPSTLMLVVPEEEWRNLHATLAQIIDLITRRNADDSSSEWIESEAARKLLGVSPKTWQNYRDQRLIPFSQIGRKSTSTAPTSTPSSALIESVRENSNPPNSNWFNIVLNKFRRQRNVQRHRASQKSH